MLEEDLPDRPAIVSGDPEQLKQVCWNIARNALKAMPSGGACRVSLKEVEGNRLRLSFADNGCGMSPDFVRNSLFRPFQTTKKKGLGIGMFQSKMIVEAHRGNIQVESEPGKGTKFGVFLPLAAGLER